jgi:RNA polymerase sigma-70 factor, ECF subfamily
MVPEPTLAQLAIGRPVPYQVQAAIACLHAAPARPEDVDRPQIAALYGTLVRMHLAELAAVGAGSAAAGERRAG